MGISSLAWINILYLLVSVSFVFLGHFGQKAIGDANKCKMTYSRPEQIQVPINTSIDSYKPYKLFRHVNKQKDGLEKGVVPVLFLPGNSGSSAQVRSIATFNDGTFQFYAVHFGQSMSATHGSVMLSQAAFVNDALRYISSEHGTHKVIILAHSAGGMVARTAMILSNYPRCYVSGIIMFGTPNSRPSYAPDASLATLYAAVNGAWRKSFYTTSAACLAVSDTDDYDPAAPITSKWSTCTPCLQDVKIISISGGEIDMQVPSVLSHLNAIAPHPHNTSATLPSPVKIGNLLKPKGGYVRYVFNTIHSLVSPLLSPRNESEPTSEVDQGDALGTEKITQDGEDVVDVKKQRNAVEVAVGIEAEFEFSEPENTTQNVPEESVTEVTSEASPDYSSSSPSHQSDSPKRHPFSTVSMESWVLHMAPYVEPPHVSVRTSQMAGVGFPVDHLALLWCNQVMQSVNRYMHRIVKSEGKPEISMDSIVKLKSEFVFNGTSDDMIPPLEAYIKRNASLAMYGGAAVDAERRAMYSVLSDSPMWLMATVFNTSYISAILTCYILIPLLVMATDIFFQLGDKKVWAEYKRPKSAWEALLPSNHLFLGIFDDIFMIICPQLYCFIFANVKYIAPLLTAVCAAVMAIDSMDPVVFLQKYGFYFQWIVAYGVAVVIHMLFLAFLTTLRFVISVLSNAIYTILRWTVWCNFIRGGVKAAVKPLRKKLNKVWKLVNVEYVAAMGVVSAVALGSFLVSQRRENSTGAIILYTSVCFLVMTSAFYCAFVVALFWKPKHSSKLLDPLVALYLPAVILTKPSMIFCYSILTEKRLFLEAMSSVFDIFGPELINYTLCVTCIFFHLIYALRMRDSFKPVAFISEIFDMSKTSHRKWQGDGSAPNMFSLSGSLSSGGSCLHEDGGELAVFESNDEGVCSKSKGAVLIGPAFKVVSCNCSLNRKLQSFGEWCEWCRCEKCGGKVLPKMGDGGSYQRTLSMPDLSSDLVAFVATVFIAGGGMMYAHDQPFKNMYIVGGIGAVFIGRRVGRALGY